MNYFKEIDIELQMEWGGGVMTLLFEPNLFYRDEGYTETSVWSEGWLASAEEPPTGLQSRGRYALQYNISTQNVYVTKSCIN